MFLITRFLCAGLTAALISLSTLPALAQNLFKPVIYVNEGVITQYDIIQRQRFAAIISPANSGEEQVREELIADRLRAQELRSLGIRISGQALQTGMAEFAARANMSTEQFITALGSNGVEPETFRDFVAVGLGWRDLIQARYGGRAQISNAEIDRALQASGARSSVRVLVSEIILPAPPQRAKSARALAERIANSKTTGEFASYARRYSAAPTRSRGGALGWRPLSEMPAPLRPLLLNLAPGETTPVLSIPNALAIFQLRDIEEIAATEQKFSAIEYARLSLPSGSQNAATERKIRNRMDSCDDLYGFAKRNPSATLTRETKIPVDIPLSEAQSLALLDPDEIAPGVVSQDGSTFTILMLCGRSTELTESLSRGDIRARLRQQRLESFAESYLQELRADARIRQK